MTYEDPEDPEDKALILKAVSLIRCEADVFVFLDEFANDWIVKKCPEYCDELQILSINWGKICDALKQSKKSILIVKKTILSDPENKFIILRAISEILTRCGYCIRSKDEIDACEGCNLAIISGKKLCFKCE